MIPESQEIVIPVYKIETLDKSVYLMCMSKGILMKISLDKTTLFGASNYVQYTFPLR